MTEANNTTQKIFEKGFKKGLFARIDDLCESQYKLLSNIRETESHLDLEIDELPNIGITFNNKIIELLHIFQDAGLSMFSQSYKNWGPKKSNFIASSFLGDSIIFYMLDRVEEGVESLANLNKKLDSLINSEREKCNAFYSANPIKRMTLMAQSYIKVPPELDFSYSVEDIFELNSYALTYKAADNVLWSSTLQDIIVPSLVSHIKRNNFDRQTILDFFNNSMIADLEKLGLSALVPKLKQEIIKVYEDAKEPTIEDETR